MPEIEVHKVIGAPGTGKTTEVVGNPDLGIEGLFMKNLDEYDVDEQMLVTYTNAGVDEAVDRLSRMLNTPEGWLRQRIRTIHSSSGQIIDIDYDNELAQWYHEKEFCTDTGLGYGFSDDEGDMMTSEDSEPGNQLMDIYGWLQSNRLEITDSEEAPAEWGHQSDLEEMMKKWESFKEINGLKSFADMIEQSVEMAVETLRDMDAGDMSIDIDHKRDYRKYLESCREDDGLKSDDIRGKPGFVDTHVMYVDECQDLTKLQWDWYLTQKLVCDKVFLGFDDDQTIYGWSGADPDQPLSEEGNFEVLEQTYRIPKEIWEVCDGVIKQVEQRQDKDVKPADDGGSVVTMRRPLSRDVIKHIRGDQSVLILFRARFHIDEFRDDLHSAGIPYDNMSTFETWSEDIVAVRDALYKIQDNGVMSRAEVDTLVELCDSQMLNASSKKAAMTKVSDGMNTAENVMEKVFSPSFPDYNRERRFIDWYIGEIDDDHVNYYEGEAIKGNLRNGDPETDPSRVRIGTIHSAKGKEAETVILGTDSTETILANMDSDDRNEIDDAERRVMYVGMTRASEKLVLGEGIITPTCTIGLNDLLEQDD